MSLLDQTYIKGVASALHETGICKIANLSSVAALAEIMLSRQFVKTAAGEPMAQDVSPQELAQVAQSGLTENDIQSAAKVVQVIAEMKQQSDAATMGQNNGMPATAPPGQPPLPPPPQPAQMPGAGGGDPSGGMGGGGGGGGGGQMPPGMGAGAPPPGMGAPPGM